MLRPQAAVARVVQDFPELATGARKLTVVDVVNRKTRLFPRGEQEDGGRALHSHMGRAVT